MTIYGDVVEPRGGTLWIGTLIEVCAGHGISEGLVRTAVSRLVASGRLSGERIGRKSYYRLTAAARSEFAAAAKVFFDAPQPAEGWLFRFGDDEVSAAVQSAEWANAGPCHVAPRRQDLTRSDGLLFAADVVGGEGDLVAWAERHWDLAPVENAYGGFVDLFRGVLAEIDAGYEPDGAVSLALRLRVLHEYRRILLADPRLPAAALPATWPAAEARGLFVALYVSLADAADRHVQLTFSDTDGPLPLSSPTVAARVEGLRRERTG